MLNQYPVWKNLLVVFVLVIGLFYALPNVFSQDPAIAVTGLRSATVDESMKDKLAKALEQQKIQVKSMDLQDGRLLVRLDSNAAQQKAQHVIANALSENYSYALTSAANVPGWLSAMGGKPMNLGLDLRGGIHVLIDVDMDAAIKDKVEAYTGDVRSTLRKAKIRYLTVKADANGINVKFKDAATETRRMMFWAMNFAILGLRTRTKPEPIMCV